MAYKTQALPLTGALGSVIKGAQRLNPALDLEVDVLAVQRAAVAIGASAWGSLSSVVVDGRTGALTLGLATPAVLFSQTTSAATQHWFRDANDGLEPLALDFFLNPAAVGGAPVVLDSLDVHLGKFSTLADGVFTTTSGEYTAPWRVRV